MIAVDKFDPFSNSVDEMVSGVGALDYQAIINEAFPLAQRAKVPPLIATGYRTVEDTMRSQPYLSHPDGDIQRGHLLNPAVAHELRKACGGQLAGFVAGLEQNIRNTAPYFFISNEQCVVTFSRTTSPGDFPREAHFRNKLRLADQLPFAFMCDSADQLALDRLYLICTHGGRPLSHVYLGIPHPTEHRWCFQINLLKERPASDIPKHEESVTCPSREPNYDGAFPTLRANAKATKKQERE